MTRPQELDAAEVLGSVSRHLQRQGRRSLLVVPRATKAGRRTGAAADAEAARDPLRSDSR
ncbi:MAG: hypothetical protein ACYCSI_14250 [Solirubrobacteraceae bacterium]